jgi:nitroreductase
MLEFSINRQRCIHCGLCQRDCLARIIILIDGTPTIAAEDEKKCLKCQHCLAICPKAALSIFGINPDDLRPLKGNLPEAYQLETLICGRRTIRHYRDKNVDPTLIQHLLNVANHAASGFNTRQVLFTVIDDLQMMAKLRDKVIAGLDDLIRAGELLDEQLSLKKSVELWQQKKIDVLFRGAPHLLIASAPRECSTPYEDCIIALTTFELYAQCLGVGTVWDGFAYRAINEHLPEIKQTLRIPDNHIIGYMMAFGYPAVQHKRTVHHGEAHTVRVDWLE